MGVAASHYFRAVHIDGTPIRAALAERLASDADAPSSGPQDASVSLIVFTDYRCPACRRAHPAMLEAVAKDGDTRIVYRDLPIFGPPSEDAARIAIAANEQGLYTAVHDAFMRERRPLTPAVMAEVVTGLGGNWQSLMKTIEAGGPTQRLVANRRDAMALGIVGTPTYVSGRFKYTGALTETQFEKAIDKARQN
ncbi:DsbA family protein [Erythrobacter litoralis]|uniref:DsbA family protein n=1 Tax=Erythrobacter litoralis TaxID=39960 RepID=UPI002435B0E2|nr:thioredoxin domain-containing protein [Erythrobacter litoralis]